MAKGTAKWNKRPNRLLYALGKALLIPYFRIRYRLRIHRHDLPDLTPPYVVVANHASSLDFALMMLSVKGLKVQVVTATVFFYDPLLRKLLRWMACVPKLQMVSDPVSVRSMLTVIKSGGVLGLFPHGQVSYSGSELPMPPGGGKLLKRMGVPIVNIKIQGAHLTKPKWSRRQRRGQIVADVSMLLTPEQLETMTGEEVEELLVCELSFNDYEWNKAARIPYSCNNRAVGLERALYQCPRCHALYKMETQGDRIFCTQCQNGARMDEYGQLHPLHQGDIIFSDPVQWTAFERTMAKAELMEKKEMSQPVTLFVGDDKHPKFKKCGEGILTLTMDRLRFVGTKNGEAFELCISNAQLAGLPFSFRKTYWEIPGAKQYYRMVPDLGLSLLHMALGLEAAHELEGEKNAAAEPIAIK